MWWRDQVTSWKFAGSVLALLSLVAPVWAQETIAPDESAMIKNVEFQGSEIRSAMTFLADYGKVNVVVAPDVTGTVTIRLRDVNWRDAMDIIGRTYDLAIVDDRAGYIRVMKSESYREELTKQSEHDANQMKLVALETKIVKIAKSVAGVMVETVKNLMTERG